MKVRDRTKKKSEYQGRLTDASDIVCPCRSCWHPHDCGYNQKVYKDGVWTSNKWLTSMSCVTRYNSGCPTPKPEPQHDFGKKARCCKRCGSSKQWEGS